MRAGFCDAYEERKSEGKKRDLSIFIERKKKRRKKEIKIVAHSRNRTEDLLMISKESYE